MKLGILGPFFLLLNNILVLFLSCSPKVSFFKYNSYIAFRRCPFIFLSIVFLCVFGKNVLAEHFLWILEFSPEGVYGKSISKIAPKEGIVYESSSWTCTIKNGWNEVNGWMLLETRTLSCQKKGDPQTRDLQIFCREHESPVLRTEQRTNTKGMYLGQGQLTDSMFVRMSCMPLSMRIM